MDTKWVHTSGQSQDGFCLACDIDADTDEITSDAHEPMPSPESSRDEPFCDVCGHDIDLVMRHSSHE
jgi:hypothetical protein